MSIHYRLLRSDEEDRAVAFWMRVLETNEHEARQTFHDFQDTPERFNQTHVAVAEDGQIVATVCYWLRAVRDATGNAVPVGHLFHVATEPTTRRRGHATRLLADTIAALREAGCHWALLSARQDAVALYQRAGWQPTPRHYWRGTHSAVTWPNQHYYPVQQYDPRQDARGWLPIATAYAQANAHQAGSLIRSPAYWEGYAAWMFGLYLDDYQARLLTVGGSSANDPIRGYALTNFYPTGFVISEIATNPSDPAVLASLLNGIITEADQRGIPLQGQLTIPNDAMTQATLQQFFHTSLHYVHDTAIYGYLPFMIKSLGDATVSPFAADQGLFWPLDAY